MKQTMNNRIRIITTFLFCITFLAHGQIKLSEDILINKTFESFIDTLKNSELINQVDTFYFNDPTYKSEDVWNGDRIILKEQRLDTVIEGVKIVFTSMNPHYIATQRKSHDCYHIDFRIHSVQQDKIIVSYHISKIEFNDCLFKKPYTSKTSLQPWYSLEMETTENLIEKIK